jgi:hypothetical protein
VALCQKDAARRPKQNDVQSFRCVVNGHIFEVITVVRMLMLVFWVATPYGLERRQLGRPRT